MKFFVVLAALLHVSLAGVSVTMPYLNPAGVTYVQQPQLQVQSYVQPQLVAHQEAIPVAHAAVPIAHAAVPITHEQVYHQQLVQVAQPIVPAVIHKELDVAQPGVKTSRIQVRRPAIQKQFYDVEERTIVRPAGSALVELDQPHSKVQEHPSIVGDVALPHPAPIGVPQQIVAQQPIQQEAVFDDSVVVEARRARPQQRIQQQPQQQFIDEYQQQIQFAPRQLQQQYAPQQLQQAQYAPQQLQQAQFIPQEQQQQQSQFIPQQRQQLQQSQFLPQQRQQLQQSQFLPEQRQQQIQPELNNFAFEQQQQQQQQQQPQPQQLFARQSFAQALPQQRFTQQPSQTQALVRSQSIISPRNHISGAELNANQQRLIDLLSPESGNVEIGFGNTQFRGSGDAGASLGRVLSANKNAPNASPIQENVKTRRILVSRPIETIEEVDVHEPITKIHRIAVQQPTYAHAF